jgi:hypothetical protein
LFIKGKSERDEDVNFFGVEIKNEMHDLIEAFLMEDG